MTSDANLPHDVGVAIEAQRLVDQRRIGAGRRQIDEDAARILEPLVVERHFRIELDDDPHDVGEHRAADRLDR